MAFVKFAGRIVNNDQIASIEFDETQLRITVRMSNGDTLIEKVKDFEEGAGLRRRLTLRDP